MWTRTCLPSTRDVDREKRLQRTSPATAYGTLGLSSATRTQPDLWNRYERESRLGFWKMAGKTTRRPSYRTNDTYHTRKFFLSFPSFQLLRNFPRHLPNPAMLNVNH